MIEDPNCDDVILTDSVSLTILFLTEQPSFLSVMISPVGKSTVAGIHIVMYHSFLIKHKCMIGACFKLGFSRECVFHFLLRLFFLNFNLGTFPLQFVSYYYGITLSEMD